MAPAADMKRSQRVMDESHLLSNIAPQIGIGFNRHIWAGLESLVRDWVRERGALTIIMGPVFEAQGNRVQYGVIGPNEVAAPTHFFKIVVDMNDPNNPDAIAFLMPNENLSGREPEEFITSIDDIESRTGIDFLTALSDPVERSLEALTTGAIW